MNVNLKKMWPAAAASLVFFTSLANAATGSATSDSRMQGSSSKNNMNNTPNRDVNPAARPVVKDGVDLFVSGDFLWWKAVQENLEYVATVNVGTPAVPGEGFLRSYQGRYYEPKFKYQPGFRVGIGYNLPYDGWDIFVNWTRFYNTAKDHRCAFPCNVECISSASGLVCFDSLGRVPSSTVTTAGSCGSSNSCNTCCNTCFTEPCCCNGSTSSSNMNSSSSCCNTCNQSPCCCNTDCQCCCEPCCECCEVCFDCCCPETLIPTLSAFDTPDRYGNTNIAFAKWNLKLNLLDGEIGREFFVSKYLTVRPYMGVRGAWIHQRYDVKYQTDLTVNDPEFFGFSLGSVTATQTDCACIKNNFNGVGPRAGFNTDWMLGAGFSFYANLGINLLWGQFDLYNSTTVSVVGDGVIDTTGTATGASTTFDIDECAVYNFGEKYQTTKAITDLALGLQWQGTFANDRVGLMIQIGWDQHLFFNQGNIIGFDETVTPFALMPVVADSIDATALHHDLTERTLGFNDRKGGDLSVQGLTVSARLDF